MEEVAAIAAAKLLDEEDGLNKVVPISLLDFLSIAGICTLPSLFEF